VRNKGFRGLFRDETDNGKATMKTPTEGAILPPFEGPAVPTSIRVPKKLLERLDEISRRSELTRSEVIVHILRWGCEQAESQLASDEKRAK